MAKTLTFSLLSLACICSPRRPINNLNTCDHREFHFMPSTLSKICCSFQPHKQSLSHKSSRGYSISAPSQEVFKRCVDVALGDMAMGYGGTHRAFLILMTLWMAMPSCNQAGPRSEAASDFPHSAKKPETIPTSCLNTEKCHQRLLRATSERRGESQPCFLCFHHHIYI